MNTLRKESLLIVCVDRDNDLGRKVGIEGPIIGKKANIEAANKLLLADPGESDANCIFAAVKLYEEIKNKTDKHVEIVTLTGHGKAGFQSDKRINEQLDKLEEKYKIAGFILVTDGAEDEQVLPILQSRAKIISKETLVIKQAQPVESVYYTIKEALKDPYLARIVFGIPGAVFLFYAITLLLNVPELFLRGISLIVGLYLIFKGFGIELHMKSFFNTISETFSPAKASFAFYLSSFFVFIFAAYSTIQLVEDIANFEAIVSAFHRSYFLYALALFIFGIAKLVDHISEKRAYLMYRDIMFFASVITFWILVDAATLVFLKEADLNFFLMQALFAFLIGLVFYRIAKVFDITHSASKLLVGLPAYSISGSWLGKVLSVDEKTNTVFIEKEGKKIKAKKFKLANGYVLIS